MSQLFLSVPSWNRLKYAKKKKENNNHWIKSMIRLVLLTCLCKIGKKNIFEMMSLYNYEWDQWVIGLSWIFPRTFVSVVGCYTWRMRSRRFSTKSTKWRTYNFRRAKLLLLLMCTSAAAAAVVHCAKRRFVLQADPRF